MYVYRLNKDNSPLDPIHPALARKLLKEGGWYVKTTVPFTIKSKTQLEEKVEDVKIGIKFTGEKLACSAISNDVVVYQSLTDIK
jgi:hypothetical protein